MSHTRYVVNRDGNLGAFITATGHLNTGDLIFSEVPIIKVTNSDITETEDSSNITRALKMVLNLATSYPDGIFPVGFETMENLTTPAEIMSDTQRREMVTLAMNLKLKSHSVIKFYKMVYANAFDVNILNSTQEPDATVLFNNASYFNHSCFANCNHSFSQDGTITITTARNVNAGEELTINYLTGTGSQLNDVLHSSDVFLKTLKDRFGFDCKCGNH